MAGRTVTITLPAFRSLAAKAAWTGLQVAVAGISVEQLGLPAWAIAPGAMFLSSLKSYVAAHVGNPTSTSFFK
jgi:hypothetical protein